MLVGASRFAHAGWLRHDRAFHALLGMKHFPGEDAIRRFFHRFTQGHVEVFWRSLWKWILDLIEAPNAGFSLNLDSTVFSREGNQEGVAVEGGIYEIISFGMKLAGWDKERRFVVLRERIQDG